MEPMTLVARRTGMPARLLLAALLLALVVAPYPQSTADASCAAPSLTIDGADGGGRALPTLTRGQQVTVSGRGFASGCDDVGSTSTFGCSGDDHADESEPLTDVELVLVQGRPTTTTRTSLGAADAGTADDGQLGQVTWRFDVPADQPLGRAVLKTVGSEPLQVRIVDVLPAALSAR
jgi:hypothetical protein